MDGSFITFAGLAALFVFGASRGWELWQEYRARRSFIRGLFAEIDFNTTDLAVFNEEALDFDDLLKAMSDRPDLIPHITDARHTVIYSSNMHMLSALPDRLIRDVVEFYGDLEKIREIICGLEKDSFPTISPKGKVNVLKRLYRRTHATEALGEALLSALCQEFRQLSLVVKQRPKSPRSLEARMRDLTSDLDRVRLRHNPPQ